MPIYEYKCERGHLFEVIQSMADAPVAVCQECGAPVERVFHPVAVHFKGSGFYSTDYGSKARDGSSASEDGGQSKDSDSSKDKGDAKATASSGSSD